MHFTKEDILSAVTISHEGEFVTEFDIYYDPCNEPADGGCDLNPIFLRVASITWVEAKDSWWVTLDTIENPFSERVLTAAARCEPLEFVATVLATGDWFPIRQAYRHN